MKPTKFMLVLGLLAAPGAFAAVIDFEAMDYGPIPGEALAVDVDGVTVTIQGTGLQIRPLGGDYDATYGQTRYLSTSGDSQQITVTFAGGYADYITILNPINGTIAGEVDIIDANAFDGGDVLVDSAISSDALLTLNGPGIARATYDDAVDGTGYVIGYIEFDVELAEPGTAAFRVTKTFSDGREDDVDVHLSCNSGLPLEQDFTIAGGGPGVNFVVTEIQGEATTCEVTESGGPDGYTPVFNGGTGCAWENVTAGQFFCDITNEANPAEFTVTKDWVIEGAVGEEVILEAQVTIDCSSDILTIDGFDIIEPDGSVTVFLSGDGDSVAVTVDTELGPTSCSASESIFQSGVESTDNCGSRSIAAGGSSSCTITNTVFFEGIPTLSQYGLALMALLMLGLGFVGLRRFV